MGSLISEDGRCDAENKSRIAMAKGNFGKMRRILTNLSLGMNIPVRCFASTGRRGVRRVGGQNILPSTPVAAKKTSADGGGIGVSSQGEALEEAAIGTVGERGGRPGPHPKPSKGWGPSGACMRRAPLGLVGCLGRDRGKTEGGGGVLVADSLVGIHPHPGPTRRGVRSRGEGRRRRNEARRERRRRGGQ